MSEPEHHPIVEAVLADPVVKAVLEDPSAKTQKAVSDAIDPSSHQAVPSLPVHSVPPVPIQAPVAAVVGTQTQTQTSKTADTAAESEQKALTTAGQRNVNLMWETTQAKIALAIVYVVLAVAAVLAIVGMLPWATEKQVALAITAFLLLSNLSTLVIGFYYGRTNHQRVGGVGFTDVGR